MCLKKKSAKSTVLDLFVPLGWKKTQVAKKPPRLFSTQNFRLQFLLKKVRSSQDGILGIKSQQAGRSLQSFLSGVLHGAPLSMAEHKMCLPGVKRGVTCRCKVGPLAVIYGGYNL